VIDPAFSSTYLVLDKILLVNTCGSAVYGVDAITITVEVNVMKGKNYFIVSLPENAIKESLQRIESTLKTNGFLMPRIKLLVNLAPANIRKSGSAFDLPIAIGILAGSGQIKNLDILKQLLIMGELILDGSILPVRGVLPMAIQARKEKYSGFIMPHQNSKEAAIMEERRVNISRARMSIDFPASFMLIASMNTCPCGFYNHPERACSRPPGAVQKYLNRISGPLLDRIDLHMEVTPVGFNELSGSDPGETSASIRSRVLNARDKQLLRFKYSPGIYANAQMDKTLLKKICRIEKTGVSLLRSAMEKLYLSARAYDRILKVSRTIADLDEKESIQAEHLAEAIQYRSLDRESWAG
jgi:predicted ATPase with chaperone activity